MDAYKFATAKLCGRREKPELVKVEEKQIVLAKEANKPLDEQTQKIDSTINAFEQKYHVHELIRNSANGVVYGKFIMFDCSPFILQSYLRSAR